MAMIENRRKKSLIALSMVTPFVLVFTTFFLYPLIEMVRMSFTDAPLIGEGNWVGLENYAKLLGDRLFVTSLKNNGYFVLLTVVPTTVIALMIALAISRLSGVKQTIAMSLFFLPYVLPVSVVTEIWAWMLDL
jgi:multiple sugar transport system permease protein